jgi:hypothetical protein
MDKSLREFVTLHCRKLFQVWIVSSLDCLPHLVNALRTAYARKCLLRRSSLSAHRSEPFVWTCGDKVRAPKVLFEHSPDCKENRVMGFI